MGVLGKKGKSYEFDIYVNDDEWFFIGTKFSAELEDVEFFLEKVNMAVQNLGLTKVRKVLVTLNKEPEVLVKCSQTGIIVL